MNVTLASGDPGHLDQALTDLDEARRGAAALPPAGPTAGAALRRYARACR